VQWHPAVVFLYGFLALIMAGTILLALPVASATGDWTPVLDALFTATSAVCLTGLVVVDTGTYWSGVGQAIILALVQIGGFGFMTSSTLLLLLIGRRVSLRERLLLREALGSGGPGSVLALARRVFVFTVIAEVLGILVLTTRFLADLDPPRALWWGVFHAVSAFNNAGFDLVGDYRSLIPYNHDPAILLTILALLTLGAISYTTVEDVVRQRRFARLTLDSKLVLVVMASLLVGGTLVLLFTERRNVETLGAMDDRRWTDRPYCTDVHRRCRWLDRGRDQGPNVRYPVLRHRRGHTWHGGSPGVSTPRLDGPGAASARGCAAGHRLGLHTRVRAQSRGTARRDANHL
jgi:trk system potassium uptake protein TrkH